MMKKVFILFITVLMMGCSVEKNIDLSEANYAIIKEERKPLEPIKTIVYEKEFIETIEDMINEIELKELLPMYSIKGGKVYRITFFNSLGESIKEISIVDDNLHINKEGYLLEQKTAKKINGYIEQNINGS